MNRSVIPAPGTGPASVAALLALFSAVCLTVQTVTDWTDAGTKRGIALAFRDDPALDAREVRATTELPFAASAIFAIVCDLSQYQTLVPGVREAKVLSGTIPGDYEIYLQYAPRFLVVAARDVVVRVQGGSTAPGVFGCAWSEMTGRLPDQRGIVRMPLLRGKWSVETIDETRSRVVYQVTVKPGGSLPGWLVRRGASSALPEVIEQVTRRLGTSTVRGR